MAKKFGRRVSINKLSHANPPHQHPEGVRCITVLARQLPQRKNPKNIPQRRAKAAATAA